MIYWLVYNGEEGREHTHLYTGSGLSALCGRRVDAFTTLPVYTVSICNKCLNIAAADGHVPVVITMLRG